MRVVLDTPALIYLNDFRKFDEMLTVGDVLREVRDSVSAMKLAGLDVKIIEPDKESIEKIKNTADGTGDLEKLSETDVKVLALALEKNCIVVSDDRNIQNVAEKIGIKYIGVFTEKISKLVIWKKFCSNCKKSFDHGDVCNICGNKLSRRAEKKTLIKM